ncbi:ArsR/SmtB family transcription factor [Maribacter sp. 2-571]|uniref:ArsR/SmtB family transcription factor n=1 Tax=Maribacter sp. 2-571 TaxID=3417569 RepID=UPI003D33E7E8
MRRDVFQAIADPVRREIITVLAEEEMTINTISEKFDVSRQAISKHLKILEECGIVSIVQKGRNRYCLIRPKSLIPAFMWIEQYKTLWEEKLDSFENYLNELQSKNKNNEQPK